MTHRRPSGVLEFFVVLGLLVLVQNTVALAADGPVPDTNQALFTYQLIATILALTPLVGMILYLGRRVGAYDERLRSLEKAREKHEGEMGALRADFKADLKEGLTDAVARVNETMVLRMGVIEAKLTTDLGRVLAAEIKNAYRELPRE